MDEGFRFDPAVPADVRDFFQTQLARQHHPLESKRRKLFRPFQIVDGELCAGVQSELRKVFLRQPNDAHILNDHTVRVEVADRRQRFERGIEFTLLDERIEGDVNTTAEVMRVADQLVERLGGEIARLSAGGKARQSGVNGVRAIRQRGPRRIRRSGGRQKFWKFFVQAARTLSCFGRFFKFLGRRPEYDKVK